MTTKNTTAAVTRPVGTAARRRGLLAARRDALAIAKHVPNAGLDYTRATHTGSPYPAAPEWAAVQELTDALAAL